MRESLRDTTCKVWAWVRTDALNVGLLSVLIIALLLAGIAPASQIAVAGEMAEPQDLPLFSDATSSWSDFQPTDWVTSTSPTCTITITDSTGLQEGTARYRYSTDGGGSWTGWSGAGLSISGGISTTKYITVTSASFIESEVQNRIQFEILDTNSITDTSPSYVVKVDATTPPSPNGLAASPAGWTSSNSFDLAWTNPSDVSGIVAAYYKLDTAPSSPLDGTYMAGSDIESITGISVSGAGEHAVHVWLEDEAGNIDHNNQAQTTLHFDNVPPSAPTSFASTSHVIATWSSDNTIEVTWSGASDALSGLGGYALVWDQVPNTIPDPITTTVETSATSSALGNGDDHYVHLRTSDNAGNWTAGALHLGPFYIQSDAPGAPLNLAAEPDTWANTNQFDLTWDNPDTPAGIAGAYYKLDSPPAFDTDGTWVEGDGLASLDDISVSGDGVHPVYVWLKDHAGNVNVSNRSSTDLQLDTFRPGAPTNLTPDPAGWSNDSSFSISWTNPWDLSGISGAFYKLDAEPISSGDGTWITTTSVITDIVIAEEGSHDIYLWLQDGAGNSDYHTRNVSLGAFKYDNTNPATTHQIDGTLGQNGWYTTEVGVDLSADDALSGIDETHYRVDGGAWQTGTELTLTSSTTHTIEYHSIDNAGNEELPHSLEVKIDTLPPTTKMQTSGTVGEDSWYVSSVQVTLNASDSASGVAETYHRVDGGSWLTGLTFPIETDGIHQVEFYSEDAAGNREDVQSETVLVDMQPPITLHTTAGEAGNGNWYRSPVTITLTPTDLASGPVATYYRIDAGGWVSGTEIALAEENTHSVDFYSRDHAGNVEDVNSLDVSIDMTAPSPPFGLASTPLGWTATNTFTVTWSSLPDTSGIAGAYYKFNAEPAHDTDGTYAADATNMIAGLQVPSEGKHTIYLWLRDRAGNVNYQTRNVLDQALWFDGTPPISDHDLTGSLGLNGWYTSSVRVNLTGQDVLSGIDRYYHRLLGGDWEEGEVFQITTSGRHTVQYYAVDTAGNEESPKSTFVRVDLDPPAAPIDLQAEETGWQDINSFSVDWIDPADTSLIGAAYYKLDAPPTSAQDGALASGPLGHIDGIQVSGDGKHSIYVWLVDNAGNTDHSHYASVIDAFWYDSRPPTTTHAISGTLGIGDWYRSPVTVTLSAVDLGSGVAATIYRIDGGTWQTGTSFTVELEGTHTVQYYSTDVAGNVEPIHSLAAKIDTRPPSSHVSVPSGYQGNNVVTVQWTGWDPQPGSGILYFDVQYKNGKNGSWVPWRTATDETSSLFVGQRGRVYYFRSRASDLAGNTETFPAGHGDRWIYIEPVANGRFETGDLSSWNTGGALDTRVEVVETHSGGTSHAALLGNPELGPCYDTLPAVLPVGSAVLSQTVHVPGLPDIVVPTLSFWYHIKTYDTVWSERFQRYYDSFDVELSVAGSQDRELLLRDGNYDPNKVGSGKPVTDLGWKKAEIDLSDYAGQNVTLYFSVSNRVDQYFNTWAYLDDVSIADSLTNYRRVYLPLTMRALTGTAMIDQRMNRVLTTGDIDMPR